MHNDVRTANLLGATALAVTDRLVRGATAANGLSPSGAAALVLLAATPRLSVTELGRRVGLSQPAAARMVDGLEAEGLVERRPGLGRAVEVDLTAAGRRASASVLTGRSEPLVELVGTLDRQDRPRLERLLEQLLAQLYANAGNAQRLCRLCDREACTRGGTCPVGEAERTCAERGA